MNPALMVFFMAVAFSMGIIVGSSIRRQRARDNNTHPENMELERERIRSKERAEARALIERLADKKLDLVREAISMGYSEKQLERLDERLEEVVGPENFRYVLQRIDAGALLTDDLEDGGAARGQGQQGRITE